MRVHQPGEQERDAEGNDGGDKPDNEELVDFRLTKDVFSPQFGYPNTQDGTYVELDQRGGHAFDHGGQEEETGGDKGNDDGFDATKQNNLLSGILHDFIAKDGGPNGKIGCNNKGGQKQNDGEIFLRGFDVHFVEGH